MILETTFIDSNSSLNVKLDESEQVFRASFGGMKLKVSFDEINSALDVKFIQSTCTFRADFGEIVTIPGNDVYEGDYTVTPRVYPQQLYTKDKYMLDDVTVKVIPIQRVINLSNGYTVTIG